MKNVVIVDICIPNQQKDGCHAELTESGPIVLVPARSMEMMNRITFADVSVTSLTQYPPFLTCAHYAPCTGHNGLLKQYFNFNTN